MQSSFSLLLYTEMTSKEKVVYLEAHQGGQVFIQSVGVPEIGILIFDYGLDHFI